MGGGNELRPIETHYKGYRFRSRSEARWAVFLDELGIEWGYEVEGYDLGEAGWYLPDFWLPQQECWIEVKGAEPTSSEHARARTLCENSARAVLIVSGQPGDDAKWTIYYWPSLAIYCAGRIGKADWRHEVCPDLRSISHQIDDIREFPGAPLLEKHRYVGPVLLGCNHGCYHGPNEHGAGATTDDACRSASATRDSVHSADCDQIRGSDLLFAWIDDTECYGTIAEIGYAAGGEIPIVVARPPRPGHEGQSRPGSQALDGGRTLEDLWFVEQFAQRVIEADSPRAGLEGAIAAIGVRRGDEVHFGGCRGRGDCGSRWIATAEGHCISYCGTPCGHPTAGIIATGAAATAARSARFEHGEQG